MELAGKVALVTGSTSGIGLGIVRAFAARGAKVMMNGLQPSEDLQVLRQEIESEHGVGIGYTQADMLDAESIDMMVARCESTLGGVDILVNNAGAQHVCCAEEFPMDQWRRVMMLGTIAPFFAMKRVLPGMKARKWGRIINMASVHALVASPNKSAYVGAKHALAGLTKSIALETATDGITVNAIAPGYVWTPLVEKQIPDTMRSLGLTEEEVKRDVLLGAQPMGRFVTVEEVAAFASFLASSDAAAITGAILPIDGGWTAR